jgi:hypothetical protein
MNLTEHLTAILDRLQPPGGIDHPDDYSAGYVQGKIYQARLALEMLEAGDSVAKVAEHFERAAARLAPIVELDDRAGFDEGWRRGKLVIARIAAGAKAQASRK